MAKKEEKKDIRQCVMCVEAKDFHELNHKGEPFMCKCRFHKWSRFLYSTNDVCDHFHHLPQYTDQLREAGLLPGINNRKRR